MTIDPNDEFALQLLAGASFGPNAKVTLPSGRELGADEAQALTSFYAPAAQRPDEVEPSEESR
jgi:hypothetical protein